MQRSAGIVRQDVDLALQQNIAGVETFVHVHDSDPSLSVAGGDGGLNRRRAAMPGQQRCVQIQTSRGRNFQNIFRQDLSVGHDHNHIRCERPNLLNRFSIFDPRRLQDRHLSSGKRLFDRGRFDTLIAPGRFVRLRDDPGELMLSQSQKSSQRRHADFARANKDDAHAASYGIS